MIEVKLKNINNKTYRIGVMEFTKNENDNINVNYYLFENYFYNKIGLHLISILDYVIREIKMNKYIYQNLNLDKHDIYMEYIKDKQLLFFLFNEQYIDNIKESIKDKDTEIFVDMNKYLDIKKRIIYSVSPYKIEYYKNNHLYIQKKISKLLTLKLLKLIFFDIKRILDKKI